MAYLGQVDRKASNVQVFNVTSSTSATHSIGWTPPSEQTLIVTINGVKQHTNAYSFSGAVLTLSSALVATDELEVIGINDIGNSLTPVDGSVTASKLGADSVITAKILDNNVTLAKMADGTQGDTLYYGAAGAPTLLAKPGTPADEVLTFATGASAPSWAAAAAGTNTPSFGAYLAANQSLAVDTWTKITFNTEAWDSDSAFDHATNYRFTVPDGESGKYFFSVSTTIDDVGGGDSLRSAYLALYKNGVAFQSVLGKNAARQSIMYASFATVIELSDNGVSANDYVEFFAYINWDQTDGCCSGGQLYTFCSGFKLL